MPYWIRKWYQLGSLILGIDWRKGKTPSLSWKIFRMFSRWRYKELNQGCRSLSMNLKRMSKCDYWYHLGCMFLILTEAWIYDDWWRGSHDTFPNMHNCHVLGKDELSFGGYNVWNNVSGWMSIWEKCHIFLWLYASTVQPKRAVWSENCYEK